MRKKRKVSLICSKVSIVFTCIHVDNYVIREKLFSYVHLYKLPCMFQTLICMTQYIVCFMPALFIIINACFSNVLRFFLSQENCVSMIIYCLLMLYMYLLRGVNESVDLNG